MDILTDDVELNTKLSITFPTSNEDHRLQLIEINGAIFAIVHAPLESQGPIRLQCEDWSLILLSPIKSTSHIVISAINVICLSEISSQEGNINLHASNLLVKFAGLFTAADKVSEIAEKDECTFDDDPGALLYFYRLFEGVVKAARSEDRELLSQAQQQVITALCTLADRIQNKTANLDLQKVLDMWNIPQMKG